MKSSHQKGEAEFSEAAVGGLQSRGSLILGVVTQAGTCRSESVVQGASPTSILRRTTWV